MFDIGALELLVLAIVAIIVIGPKDMPAALRVAGRWVGKLRRASAQFRSGFDALVREAEMEDMEKKWKEQNERIMAETPSAEMESFDPISGYADSESISDDGTSDASTETKGDEPMLPLDPSKGK